MYVTTIVGYIIAQDRIIYQRKRGKCLIVEKLIFGCRRIKLGRQRGNIWHNWYVGEFVRQFCRN